MDGWTLTNKLALMLDIAYYMNQNWVLRNMQLELDVVDSPFVSYFESSFRIIGQGSAYHQQQLLFPSETPGCSGRLWRLWRIGAPYDRESDATCHPSDASRCIIPVWRLWYHSSYSGNASRCILRSHLQHKASFSLRPECVDLYAPLEWHGCYTLPRGCSYAVAVYPTPGDVYAFLRPIATCRTVIYV
jgi:hypothetical protein